MKTITQTYSEAGTSMKEEHSAITKMFDQLEDIRLAVVPSMLLPVLCLSGIAAGFGAQGDLLKLIIMIIPNIFAISFTLGLSPIRWVVTAFILTIIMDLLVLVL